MSQSQLQVIVVDDRIQFALHVWRYLSRSVGFGIGATISEDRVAKAMECPLETPNGDASVTWVRVGRYRQVSGRWEEDLRKAVTAVGKASSTIYLIDVRGDGSEKEELWEDVCDELEGAGVTLNAEKVWLVSSYGVGVRERKRAADSELVRWHVKPKSAETLQELARQIWTEKSKGGVKKASERSSKVDNDLHFLVTGAGFEFKVTDWPEISPLGVPPTDEVLLTAYENPAWPYLGDQPVESLSGSYPLPRINGNHELDGVRAAGGERNLDKLWSSLLRLILDRYGPQFDRYAKKTRTPAEVKLDMLDSERRARESFRSAFLAYDWGLLTQTVDAASLPWDVWLTTNYTRFVDRAIALLEAARASDQELPDWQIISIAAEAELLLRRLFFEEGDNREIREETMERYVFKLHGDLAHLSTMAIAGDDKEMFSPLTHSVSSLHWMYEAAGRWIERLLLKRRPENVYWHIVGHGLKDEVLVHTIRSICRSDKKHKFLLVGPPADEKAEKKLMETFDSDRSYRRHLRADQWLAELAKGYRSKGQILVDGRVRLDRRSPLP